MLIKDKYNPIFLKDFIINKKIAEKYSNFYNKLYITNTIIYGEKGSGKYTFIKSIINTIYDKNIVTNKIIIKLGSKEHKILSSNYHFEILVDKYNNNNNNICEIINYLTESDDINNLCNFKIIIIRNLNVCKNELLLFLKNKIESLGNYRFFITTNKISSINKKYKGLFHFIKFVKENNAIITTYFENKIDNFNKKLFQNIIKDTSNLNIILTNYELGLLNKSKSFLDLKYKKIFDLIKDSINNPENIVKIRDEIYEINIKNINFSEILIKLFNELLKDKNIENKKKHDIINAYSKYSINIVNCYKEQIHYESLLSNIIYIYHK
jgi:ABC-type dipeptide/oligopeptide/nickel transport system ATPase component